MTTISKTFGSFVAFIEPNEDREGVNCFVQHKASGDFNSLALLQDMGEFDDTGTKIGSATLDQIEAWATGHGY